MAEGARLSADELYELRRLASGKTSPTFTDLARALDRALGHIDALRSQIPEGMQECTIIFRQCALGHAWLTANNWMDHGCPTCARKPPTPEAVARDYDHARAGIDCTDPGTCATAGAALARLRAWAAQAKVLGRDALSMAQMAVESGKARLSAESERDAALDKLRAARSTLQSLSESGVVSEHAHQELACHLDDEPAGPDGARIVTRIESERDALKAQVEELKETLRAAHTEVAAKQALLDVAGQDAGRLEDERDAARQEAVLNKEYGAASERDAVTARAERDVLRAQVATLEREKEERKSGLQTMQNIVNEAVAARESAEREASAHMETLSHRGREIDALKRKVEAAERRVAELEDELALECAWRGPGTKNPKPHDLTATAKAIRLDYEAASEAFVKHPARVCRSGSLALGRLRDCALSLNRRVVELEQTLPATSPAPAGLLEAVGKVMDAHEVVLSAVPDTLNAARDTRHRALESLRAAYEAANGGQPAVEEAQADALYIVSPERVGAVSEEQALRVARWALGLVRPAAKGGEARAATIYWQTEAEALHAVMERSGWDGTDPVGWLGAALADARKYREACERALPLDGSLQRRFYESFQPSMYEENLPSFAAWLLSLTPDAPTPEGGGEEAESEHRSGCGVSTGGPCTRSCEHEQPVVALSECYDRGIIPRPKSQR